MQVAYIQFKEVGKKYYFDPKNIKLNLKDPVVVETIKGVEVGFVYSLKEVNPDELTYELKDIIRVATAEDLKRYNENQEVVADIIIQSKQLVTKHNLDMKIINAEYTLDRKKLLIYFEAEGRIDFRDLVKDFSEIYHTRIELRQIGPRDTAKMVGGIGPCGLILCCATFIGEFEAVSIKMAKNQNLALNPQKISGSCGKLLCCIKYEDETYAQLRNQMPDLHDKVNTAEGVANVIGLNILAQKIQLRHRDGKIEWIDLANLNNL